MDASRRSFLRAVGTGLPTIALAAEAASPAGIEHPAEPSDGETPAKFVPIDLAPHFNCSPAAFGPRVRAAKGLGGILTGLTGEAGTDGLIRTPTGKQRFWGIPFSLGPAGINKKCWVALSNSSTSISVSTLEIPCQERATFLCLAAFCDWDPAEAAALSDPHAVTEQVGQQLAEAVWIYQDGTQDSLPIRRRFEVNAPSITWGRFCFTAVPHLSIVPVSQSDPLSDGTRWGGNQTGVLDLSGESGPDGKPVPLLWICALANPHPERALQAVRLAGTSVDPILICGLTLARGTASPLRYQRLSLYRLTLPEATARSARRWKAAVDLGTVARTFTLGEFSPAQWLTSPRKGLGEPAQPVEPVRQLYVELTATPDATLTLQCDQTGERYSFDLGKVVAGSELAGTPAGPRIEILERQKVLLHGQVLDAATHRPTPVRLAFRSKEGRYIPPYGHRTEVNDGFFQDYGADVKLMDTPFAYVDGTFQVELPVGDVYVEITKGFEYEAVRRRVKIEPGQREIDLDIGRFADFRSGGWVTADTHVHFLSPSTAILEGQAEGLNLINLLAAQWGDLFTNMGDFFQGPLTSPDGETIVRMGTENRQHILGHLGLLGGHGAPVYPLSAGGPTESYLGDPVWDSLSGWAEKCRKRDGVAIAAHFPYPAGEAAAAIALGRIDAVELRPLYGRDFNNAHFVDWYRCLNCGYRLPAVTGTDKMGAYMPVGATRTYAYLGGKELTFNNWAQAVRGGHTFVTSGPLLSFHVDGRMPGEEINLPGGEGTVEVRAEAKSFVPIHRLEVILNGKVVASREESGGASQITLREKVHVRGPGWLAVRCASTAGPTTLWHLHVLAHTSPVYLAVPGKELFSPQAATYMLTLIQGCEAWVENLATQPDPERLGQIRNVFASAQKILHDRLHAHGVPH